MVAPLVLTVLLLLFVTGLVWVAFTHERTDETERFNRAREITSSWADPSLTADPEPVQEPVRVPDDEAERRHR
jgi:hypothetical protein